MNFSDYNRANKNRKKPIHERFIEFHAYDDEQIVLNAVLVGQNAFIEIVEETVKVAYGLISLFGSKHNNEALVLLNAKIQYKN